MQMCNVQFILHHYVFIVLVDGRVALKSLFDLKAHVLCTYEICSILMPMFEEV